MDAGFDWVVHQAEFKSEYECDRCEEEVPDGEGHYPKATGSDDDTRICEDCYRIEPKFSIYQAEGEFIDGQKCYSCGTETIYYIEGSNDMMCYECGSEHFEAEARPISDDDELLAVYDDAGEHKGFIEMEDDEEEEAVEIDISDDEMNEIAEIKLGAEYEWVGGDNGEQIYWSHPSGYQVIQNKIGGLIWIVNEKGGYQGANYSNIDDAIRSAERMISKGAETFEAEKLHPGLYRYKGKIKMRKGWTECQECDDLIKQDEINFAYLEGYGNATVCDACVEKNQGFKRMDDYMRKNWTSSKDWGEKKDYSKKFVPVKKGYEWGETHIYRLAHDGIIKSPYKAESKGVCDRLWDCKTCEMCKSHCKCGDDKRLRRTHMRKRYGKNIFTPDTRCGYEAETFGAEKMSPCCGEPLIEREGIFCEACGENYGFSAETFEARGNMNIPLQKRGDYHYNCPYCKKELTVISGGLHGESAVCENDGERCNGVTIPKKYLENFEEYLWYHNTTPQERNRKNADFVKPSRDWLSLALGTAAVVIGGSLFLQNRGVFKADGDEEPAPVGTGEPSLVAHPTTGDLLPADYEEMIVESTGYAVPVIPVSLDPSFMGSRFHALPTDRVVESNEPGIGAHTDVAINRDTNYREPEQSVVTEPPFAYRFNAEAACECSIFDKIKSFFTGKPCCVEEKEANSVTGQTPYFGVGFDGRNTQERVIKETNPVSLDPSVSPFLPLNLSGYTGQAYAPPTVYSSMMAVGETGQNPAFTSTSSSVGANRAGSRSVDSSTLQSVHGTLSANVNQSYTDGSRTMSLSQWSIEYDVSQISDTEAFAVSRASGERSMIRRV